MNNVNERLTPDESSWSLSDEELAEYEKAEEEYNSECDELEKWRFGEPLSEEGKFFMESMLNVGHVHGAPHESWRKTRGDDRPKIQIYEDILSRLYGDANDKDRGFGYMPGIAPRAKGWIEKAGEFMCKNSDANIVIGGPISDFEGKDFSHLDSEQREKSENFVRVNKVFDNVIQTMLQERLEAEDKSKGNL